MSDWKTKTQRAIFSEKGIEIKSAKFSPDGSKIVVLTAGHYKVLDSNTGKQLSRIELGSHMGDFDPEFTPDGTFLLVKKDDLCMYDLKTGKMKYKMGTLPDLYLTRFSSDMKYIFLTELYGSSQIVDMETRLPITILSSHTSSVTCFDLSPINNPRLKTPTRLAVGNGALGTRIWDIENNEITAYTDIKDLVSLTYSKDGQRTYEYSLGYGVIRDNEGNPGLNTAFYGGSAFPMCTDLSPETADSPPGKYIAHGTVSGICELYEWATSKGLGKLNMTKPEPESSEPEETGFMGAQEVVVQRLYIAFVGAVRFSPDGKSLLAVNSEGEINEFGLKSMQVKQRYEMLPGTPNACAYSPDGKRIVVGTDQGQVVVWENQAIVQELKSGAIPIDQIDFSEDGRYLVAVTRQHKIIIWDTQSWRKLQVLTGHSEDVTGLLFMQNNKFLLSGSLDNSMKLWDVASGQELASLVLIDSTDWAVTTPSGLFDASPGAMRSMYYVAGREVVDLDQLKVRYYQPGLLQQLLGFSDAGVRDVSTLNNVALYPDLEPVIEGETLIVKITPRSGGVGRLSFLVNGKEKIENANPDGKTEVRIDLRQYDSYWLPGENELGLEVFNKEGWLKSKRYILKYTPDVRGRGQGSGSTGSTGTSNPHLYILTVGTSAYSNPEMRLGFPDKDAKAMAESLQEAGRPLFKDRVHSQLFTSDATDANQVSSKKNIERGFREFSKLAQPGDVLVVYFSGHGITYGPAEQAQFYYLTKDVPDATLNDAAIRENYAISSDTLVKWLTSVTAQKQVLIFDACNSGKVAESFELIGSRDVNPSQVRAIDRMKDRAGVFILTGSAADRVSFEAGKFGQGLLTFSLLQGMSGLALTPDKRVDVMTLFQYSTDKVPELAQSINRVQKPMLAVPANGNSFDIGIVDATVNINVPQEKPVFIRNNFLDKRKTRDVLELTEAIEGVFQTLTAKGASAPIIYVDVKDYPNAYYINGFYLQEGDDVTVECVLFQNDQELHSFTVKGKASQVSQIANDILDEVMLKLDE
ncbi:MAG: caspase family protein [Saprospiraceae bacterium]